MRVLRTISGAARPNAVATNLLCIVLGCFLSGCDRSNASPAAAPTQAASVATQPTVVTVGQLREHPPIGELGLPLGTATEIEAVVFSGNETRRKADEGCYLLRVTQIGARQLQQPLEMKFSVPGFIRAGVASDTLQLYTLKTGREPIGGVTGQQLAKLQEGYLGKRVQLLVYEVGRFEGIPESLPKDFEVTWQDCGFGLETELIVLEDKNLVRPRPESEPADRR